MTVEERLREWIAGAELVWRVLHKREPTDNSFAPMCIDLPRDILAELIAKDAKIDALLAACKAAVEECDATFVDTSEMSPEWCEVEKMCRAAIAIAEQEQTDAH